MCVCWGGGGRGENDRGRGGGRGRGRWSSRLRCGVVQRCEWRTGVVSEIYVVVQRNMVVRAKATAEVVVVIQVDTVKT